MKSNRNTKLLKSGQENGGGNAKCRLRNCSIKRQMSKAKLLTLLLCSSFLSASGAQAADIRNKESVEVLTAVENQKDLLGTLVAPSACPSCTVRKPATVLWGSENGGGDVSFVCNKPLYKGFRDFDFSDYVYLADTAALLRNTHDWDAYTWVNSDDLLRVALTAIREESPRLAEELSAAISNFKWQEVGHLDRLYDDKIRTVPEGCKIEQLAIQDRTTGIIRVNKSLHHRLSSLEVAFLKLHEGYVNLQTPEEVQARNTTRIREKLAALMSTSEFKNKIKRSKWCWYNPSHASTFAFLYDSLSQREKRWIEEDVASGKFANRFEALRSYNLGRIYSRRLDSQIESAHQDALADNIMTYMSAQAGVKLEPEVSDLKGYRRIRRAVQSKDSLAVSDLAQVIDSVFQFSNEGSAKQACLSTGTN